MIVQEYELMMHFSKALERVPLAVWCNHLEGDLISGLVYDFTDKSQCRFVSSDHHKLSLFWIPGVVLLLNLHVNGMQLF